jgi:hypothetical protein
MIPLALLVIYCVIVFFVLIWCENTYHDGKPLSIESGTVDRKRDGR